VQATVRADGRAFIAYVLASAAWGRGLGREAVSAMSDELVAHYAVHTLLAVFKRANARSQHLLEALGFAAAGAQHAHRCPIEDDETLMLRQVGTGVAP
jgi:RimJ/RimL family protein N-acetyltransferase